jgi:hypothetical protein
MHDVKCFSQDRHDVNQSLGPHSICSQGPTNSQSGTACMHVAYTSTLFIMKTNLYSFLYSFETST